MQPKRNQLQLNNEFVVRQQDINEEGTLTACKILREINVLYNQAIILAFGDLNFYQVLTSSYKLDLLNKAHPGDLIRLESTAIISFGSSLEINIIVHKKSKKDNTIATGCFIYTMKNKAYKSSTAVFN
jgi:acyl-CoA hydrolase